MKRIQKISLLWAALALLLGAAPTLQAQSSEALLDILVRKGILTEQEAADVKVELAAENNKFNNIKAPGKTTQRLDIYGDFRGRFEGFYGDHDGFTDRNRWRYRLRLGIKASLTERFQVGLRLTTTENVGDDFPGSPISGNSSLKNNGTKKLFLIDQAYARFVALTNLDYTSAVTFGKMANPFVFSQMVFDSDYTPEGLANQFNYEFNDGSVLAINAGAFVLDELSAASHDPYLLAAQVRYDRTWKHNEANKPKLSSTFGLSGLLIANEENLTHTGVPNINTGNSRDAADVLDVNFNPIVVDGAATYWLDSMPMYTGAFPIKMYGEYMNNVAESSDNQGYNVGVKFGKAGKKSMWEAGYNYRYLEGDAWWEELVDSDFGAYYATAPVNSGQGAGYRAGTNIKGHMVKVAYSPYNALTLGVKWFYTSLIDAPSGQGDSDIHRVQADAVVKF